MKPRYDSSRAEVDESEETESKIVCLQSWIKTLQVLNLTKLRLFVFSETLKAGILPFKKTNLFIHVFQVMNTEQLK